MNGKKCKALRKLVYSKVDPEDKKQPNHYKQVRKYGRRENGQIICDLNRRKYQFLKKLLRNQPWNRELVL